jgi:CPA2 family monovalent cation:H+ antiporter-2
MDNQLDIIVDLVAALSTAFAGGWLAARFRLSPIFGYVVAGLVISPFTPGFVGDADRLRLLGDIGVVLLLFGIGTQFSTRELLQTGRVVTLLAAVQVAATLALGYTAGRALGWATQQSLFVGAAVALSSSTVMAKILGERDETRSAHGTISITWALVQDLATVVLVVLLGVTADSNADPGELALTALKIAAFLLGVLVVGVLFVPVALEQVLAVRSREVFILAIATLALGTAAAAAALDISLALGAFLAGLVLAQSGKASDMLEEVLPVRDIFAVLFFVVVGMLIDPANVFSEFHIFALLLALIVVAKFALIGIALIVAGVASRTALFAGLLLAQSAEFSFVILDAGVNDGAVSSQAFSLTVSAVGVSVLLTPLLVALATSRGWVGNSTSTEARASAIPA